MSFYAHFTHAQHCQCNFHLLPQQHLRACIILPCIKQHAVTYLPFHTLSLHIQMYIGTPSTFLSLQLSLSPFPLMQTCPLHTCSSLLADTHTHTCLCLHTAACFLPYLYLHTLHTATFTCYCSHSPCHSCLPFYPSSLASLPKQAKTSPPSPSLLCVCLVHFAWAKVGMRQERKEERRQRREKTWDRDWATGTGTGTGLDGLEQVCMAFTGGRFFLFG